MNDQYRGGNGRLLARLLEQLAFPLAVLDRKGEVVFLNSAFCQMAKLDSKQLVGQTCSWKVAADGPLAAILTALAPPAGALDGRVVLRQLNAPIVFGATESGQLFVPLTDAEGIVQATLVALGSFEQLQTTLPQEKSSVVDATSADRILVEIRSRWKNLDGLASLIGSSPGIQLALFRAQLSIAHPCHTFIFGAPGTGKLECSQGIFLGRLRAAGQPLAKGQFFSVDCRVLDADLIEGMFEIFSQRVNDELPLAARQIVLVGVDRLSEAAIQRVDRWISTNHTHCMITTTSGVSPAELSRRGTHWAKIVHRLSCIEIHLPPLSERRDDIPPMALQLLAEQCEQSDRAQLTFSPDAMDRMIAYSWPQNTRQLRHAIDHSVKQAVLTNSIEASHLPLEIQTYPGSIRTQNVAKLSPIKLDEVLQDVERTILQRALELSPRNRAGAARLLGISRPRLLRRIEQLGLDQPSGDVPSSNSIQQSKESKGKNPHND